MAQVSGTTKKLFAEVMPLYHNSLSVSRVFPTFCYFYTISPDRPLAGRKVWAESQEKREVFASLGIFTFFSPSVCRTASAGWGPGGQGSAGLRSSWVTFLSVIVLIRIVCRPARSAHTLSKNDTKNALYIDIDQYVWYNTQSRMFERSATPSVPITHGLTIHHMASELTAYIQPTAFMTKRIRRSS